MNIVTRIALVAANIPKRLAAQMSWRGLRSFLTENISKLDEGSVILNVGAGGRTGKVLTSLTKNTDIKIISVDIDPDRTPDVVADITAFKPEFDVDAIVMMEVLEHVKTPNLAADNIYKILKPGGMLLLSTPFLFPLHDRPNDFFRYTKYGLKELFKDFPSLEIKARDSWAEVICVLLARIYREGGLFMRVTGFFFIVLALLLYPLAILASSILRTDFATIGYTLKGIK